MPLHLLQHKSWHVGSIQNQERVRRDERNAKLKEEEEERRMQEADAERRLNFLRNRLQEQVGDEGASQSIQRQIDTENLEFNADDRVISTESNTNWGQRDKVTKRRRTDDAIPESIPGRPVALSMKHASSSAPLTGHDGHINLFPEVHATKPASKQNSEYLADKAKEAASYEAQYTMQLQRPSQPWYADKDKISQKDREKNEKRKEKEERVESRVREENDPLKAMRKGLHKMKELKTEQTWERRQRDADVGLGIDERILVESSRQHHSQASNHSSRHSRSHEGDDRRSSRHHNKHKHKSNSRSKSPVERSSRVYHESKSKRLRSRSGSPNPSSSSRSASYKKHTKHSRHLPSTKSNHDTKRDDERNVLLKRLKEEAEARETAERRKVEALFTEEQRYRDPGERWSASNDGGRGKYSRQYGI